MQSVDVDDEDDDETKVQNGLPLCSTTNILHPHQYVLQDTSFCSLRRDVDPYPASSSSHYKARHFAGHGYGQGVVPPSLSSSINRKAPLASFEDITPSLRSSSPV